MDVWETIVLAMTGNVLVMGVLGWLAQKLVITSLDRAAEVHRSQLKIDADKQVTELKDRLERIAMEHQVRFTKLHEKRAEVLAELYRLMAVGLQAANSFVSAFEFAGESSKHEKFVVAMNKQTDFFTHLDENKIYLPRKISEDLEAFLKDIRSTIIGFGVYTRIPEMERLDVTQANMMAAWIKAVEKLDQEVPKARQVLEDEFRRLLGDCIPA